MENTNQKTLNKITKLIAQAAYIKNQMVYGADNFKTLHNMVYTKSHTAVSFIDNLKGVRAVDKASKIIDSLHKIKITY